LTDPCYTLTEALIA